MSDENNASEDIEKRLTMSESLISGYVAGLVESPTLMPLVTWKLCLQEGRKFPRTILGWWRGVFIDQMSAAPVAALAFWGNAIFETILTLDNPDRELSDGEVIFCSAGGGAVSGACYGPVDLLIIHQQKMSANLYRTFLAISKEYGPLKVTRGGMLCVFRESLYATGYLGATPVLDSRLQKTFEWCKTHKVATNYFVSMFSGMIAAFITHPADTIKTCIQADLAGVKHNNIIPTIKDITQKEGIKALYKGFLPRALRICGAFFVLNNFKKVTEYLKNKRYIF